MTIVITTLDTQKNEEGCPNIPILGKCCDLIEKSCFQFYSFVTAEYTRYSNSVLL